MAEIVDVLMWSDPHGPESAETIKEVADSLGISLENRVCLGDLTYSTMSGITASEARLGVQFRTSLLKKTKLRKDVMEDGLYSDAQLEKLANLYFSSEEVSDTVARAVYQGWEDTFPLAKFLGGNWDRHVAEDVFKERLLLADEVDLEGITARGFTGGGKPPQQTFFGRGLYADHDEDAMEERYLRWQRPLVEGVASGVTTFFSHVKPHFSDEDFVDQAEEHLTKMTAKGLELRRQNRSLLEEQKNEPLQWFWGHHHGGTKVGFVEDVLGNEFLSITPGTAGINHNLGPYSSFIKTSFDKETGRVMAVNEYRIHTYHDQQEVVHYQTHTVDWENRKVDLQKHDRKLLTKKIDLEDYLGLDQNRVLNSLSLSYDGLDAEAKDKLLRQKIAAAGEHAEKISATVKSLLNKVRRGLPEKGILEGDQILRASQEVVNQLALEGAKYFGIDLSQLSDAPEDDLYRNIVIKAAFNLDPFKLNSALYDNSLPAQAWAKGLEKEMASAVNNLYQRHALEDLEAKDFQEMAELYMPLNVKRKHTFNEGELNEAIDLWASTWQQGLLTAKDLAGNSAYVVKDDYVANKKTEEDIKSLLRVEALGEEEMTSEEEGQLEELRKRELAALEGLLGKYGSIQETEDGQQVLALPQYGQEDLLGLGRQERAELGALGKLLNKHGADLGLQPLNPYSPANFGGNGPLSF